MQQRRDKRQQISQSESGDDFYVVFELFMCVRCEEGLAMVVQGERQVVRLSVVPSVGRSARPTMDNRFLICCQLFPLLALLVGSGAVLVWVRLAVWFWVVGLSEEGGTGVRQG